MTYPQRITTIALLSGLTITWANIVALAYTDTLPDVLAQSWATTASEAQNAHQQRPIKAEVTAYSCEGITNEVEKLMNCPNGITASGTIPRTNHTLACDKRLLGKTLAITLNNGTTLIAHCEDTGGAITEDRIDIYEKDVTTALVFGRQSALYSVID